MKKQIVITFISMLAVLCSCSNDDNVTSLRDSSMPIGDIILQERAQSLPNVTSKQYTTLRMARTRGTTESNLVGDTEDVLGYSYSVGNSILGSMENVKFPVLDLQKIKIKYPTSVVRKQVNSTSNYAFSYNGMDRYESNSQISKTVKTGFSLNVGLFKIGREKKMTELFKSSSSNETNRVYGELNIELIGGQYELLSTVDKRKIYARECLSPTFLTDLYRGTIGNLIGTYGPFVLRSYLTGGKAFALYSGNSSKGTTSESRERGLTTDINASVSWKTKSASASASASLSFGKNTGSGSSSAYETTGTEVYIQTFGGNPTYQAVSGPQKLDGLSVDLSAWFNSLRRENYTLIDITSGLQDEECGLYPLSDFVLEKNFRYRFDDTTNGFLESLTDVLEPKIQITRVLARVLPSGEKLYEVAAVLNTRQGDKIVLSDGQYVSQPVEELRQNENSQVMKEKIQSIFSNFKRIFKDIQFAANYTASYNPDERKPLCIRMDGFNPNKMYVYEDPNSRMVYIYDSSKKIAFSYLNDEEYGDYVLDYYGIRDWVESLPKRKFSMMILQNYTIIGL
jgi:hypothetical protein